jgi:hypothetical protein
MFIRMKMGSRAGEVQDVRFDRAKDLIALGQAEEVFTDSPALPAPKPISINVQPEVSAEKYDELQMKASEPVRKGKARR